MKDGARRSVRKGSLARLGSRRIAIGLLGLGGVILPALLWANGPEESRAPGGAILHRRPETAGTSGEETPVFVYDPDKRSPLPEALQANGETAWRPPTEPRDGEPVHTAAGTVPPRLETGPDSPLDPSATLPPTPTEAASPSSDATGPGDVESEDANGAATADVNEGRAESAERGPGAGGEPNPNEVLPDRRTEKEGTLHYDEVFEPSIVPFKRGRAFDAIGSDYGLRVTEGRFRVIEPTGNKVERGRSVFWGSLLLEGPAGERIPIPSVSPDSRILSYEATPAQAIAFERDEAGNFYATPEREGRLRLVFVTDAPSRWFGGPIPADAAFGAIPRALRPTPPREVVEAGRAVAAQLGIGGRGANFGETLRQLVAYFRSFEAGDPPPATADIYRDLALGRRGVCRHRAHAFIVTAQALGIPARYVENEAHVFVEVYVPGRDAGWMRIDLGGEAEALVVRGAERSGRHRPAEADPFERPASFEAQGLAGADAVSGLPEEGPLVEGSERREAAPPQLPIARAKVAPNLKPTTTRLEVTESLVFRGDAMAVSGVVRGPAGEPVVAGTVQILLLAGETPGSEEAVGLLGTATLDARGHFAATVAIPGERPPGAYEIVGEYLGDGTYAGSVGR